MDQLLAYLDTHCANNRVCFELIKGIPAAVAVVAIAIPTVYIAFRQYFVARAKLKLDLFDRRYAISEKTVAIFRDALSGNIAKKSPALGNPFHTFIAEARFLFGKDIEAYLKEGINNWTELWRIDVNTNGNSGVMLADDIAERQRIIGWFVSELDGAKNKFGKYLKFEKWR